MTLLPTTLKATLCAVATFVGAAAAMAEPLKVIYPARDVNAPPTHFTLRLTELALQKAGVDYQLQAKERPGSNRRLLEAMIEGGSWNVAFMGARPELEEGLRTIYFPIYRGLLGHRIGITHEDNLARLSQVKTADDFNDLKVCSGLGWSDTEVLEKTGFKVVKSQYKNLFKMTHGRRCDFFARAVFEPFDEVAQRQEELPDLVVDNSLMLMYRLPMYIFVAPGQEELAQAIERGLQIALEDGSYQELFESDPRISQARELVKEEGRTCLVMGNPLLSEKSRALPDEMFGGFSFGDAHADQGCLEVTHGNS